MSSATTVAIQGLHHMTLTVTNLARSQQFYEEILGFKKVMSFGEARVVMANGSALLALTLPSDPSQSAPVDDRFHENRVGLDHVSFAAASRADLENAVEVFKAKNIPHGEIRDLGEYGLPLYVLAFRDPDNIQLELSAPHG